MPAPALIAGAFQLLNKGLDVIFPDPKKRAEAKVLLQQAEDAGNLQELDHNIRQEQERTTRHANDMKSDSWLSKNIRPLTLVYLMLVFSFMALFDGNIGEFSIDTTYVEAYVQFLKLALMFYFVGRSAEKGVKMWKGEK